MRLLLTGGGTGGHIYPALTIAAEVGRLAPEAQFLYVGTAERLEADLVPKAGLPFATIRSGMLKGRGPIGKLRGGLSALVGVGQALRIIRRFRPDLVLGTGGFVAGPVLLAARLAGVPVAIQEQNAYPSVTNRLAARWAKAVYLPFAGAREHFGPRAKTVFTGNPVRREVLAAAREAARQALGYRAGETVILVTCGSQGSRVVNQALVAAAGQLLAQPGLRLLHATGKGQYDEVMAGYAQAGLSGHPGLRVEPYLYEMAEALAAADLVVGRAGAGTLAEITARGLPALLVPYPYAADDHQRANAKVLTNEGAALVLEEAELTGEALATALLPLVQSPARRQQMAAASRALGQPGAGEAIARHLMGLIKQ